MSPRSVVLISVVLSVLTSALTTTLLTRDRSPSPRSAGDARVAPAAPDRMVAADAQPIAELKQAVRRIEARLDAQGAAPALRSKEEALQALLAITQGERQVAIAASFQELVALGNDVVPDVAALLKLGHDQDWGGAIAVSGNLIRGYPRLRTLLIDVLRQIGTPEALKGLVDGLRGTEDMTDFRDVFLLFRTTSDPTMVDGMSAMVPAVVRGLKGADPKRAFMLVNSVAHWVRQHEFPDKLDLVEGLARDGFTGDHMDHDSFQLLVSLAPERAFELTREVRERQGEHGLNWVAMALVPGDDIPRAQVVRYAELLLASRITELERRLLFEYLPRSPCQSIQPPAARTTDARILLGFLKDRLGEETNADAKSSLVDHIGALERALQQ